MSYDALCKQINSQFVAGDMNGLLASVRRLAMRRLRGDEDTAQDVCMWAWKCRESVTDGNFARYVNSTIRNWRIHAATRGIEPVEQFPNGFDISTEQFVDAGAQANIVFSSAKAQVAFTLKAEGFTDEEIAERLGMKLTALTPQIQRWRQRIKVA